MNRVLSAARLHAIHAPMALGIPWVIVGSSFAINLAVWAAMPTDARADGGTGGVVSLYITVTIVFLQSVTQLFPLAMGLSLTRRTFYLGTLLAAVVQALAFAVLLTLLTLIENATGGWGLGLSFWSPGRLDVGNTALQVLVFAVPLLLASAAGIGLGVVIKRWGQIGVWSLTIAGLLSVGLAAVLVTWRGSWGDVASFFLDAPLTVLVLLLPGLAALALAVLGFIGLRRTVP